MPCEDMDLERVALVVFLKLKLQRCSKIHFLESAFFSYHIFIKINILKLNSWTRLMSLLIREKYTVANGRPSKFKSTLEKIILLANLSLKLPPLSP